MRLTVSAIINNIVMELLVQVVLYEQEAEGQYIITRFKRSKFFLLGHGNKWSPPGLNPGTSAI
jgi:hypothetical protein